MTRHRLASGLVLSALRDAPWLTAARATAYARIIFTISLVAAIGWVLLSSHGIDRVGHPLGTDFTSFWAASHLALQGRPAGVYHPAIHQAAQDAIFGRRLKGYAAFFYPPPFLLVCLPFALLPYLWSLVVWQAVTGFAWLRVVQALLRQRWIVPVLAYPAAFMNLGHGQNGFLTAVLFGAGSLALPRRPGLAGLCFGCMIIKPQLMILWPVLLLLRCAWRTIASAVATAAALVAVTLIVFGPATWEGFLRVSSLARETLERGLVDPGKMQSVFAAVRALHGSVTLAYAAQGGAALVVCAALVQVQRHQPGVLALAMATACGTLLATPFVLDYDLTLLALPLAWLFEQGSRNGFLPWEKLGLGIGFILPLVSRVLALYAGVPIAPLVFSALFCLLIRRAAQAPRAEAVSGRADYQPVHDSLPQESWPCSS